MACCLSSDPLLGAAWNASRKTGWGTVQYPLWRFHRARIQAGRSISSPSWNSGSGPIPDQGMPLKSVGQARRDVIAVEQYPIEKIRMEGEIVAALPRITILLTRLRKIL